MKRDVLSDIGAALDDAATTIRQVEADVYEDAMASVRDLLDGACAGDGGMMRWATPERALIRQEHELTECPGCPIWDADSDALHLPLISGTVHSRYSDSPDELECRTARSIRALRVEMRTAHETAWLAAYERDNPAPDPPKLRAELIASDGPTVTFRLSSRLVIGPATGREPTVAGLLGGDS